MRGGAAHALDPGKTELVVGLFFLVVRENFVGFRRFLELFFRLFVPRILVGMILNGKFPVGLLYVVLRGVFLYSENLVIIALSHYYLSSTTS
jgi:hypothetical protein